MGETIRQIKEIAEKADKGVISYEEAIRRIAALANRYV